MYHVTNTNNPIDFPKTNMKLYLIDYECAHFCGGQSNVVVKANSPEEAEEKACNHMSEEMNELFSDEYQEEYGEDYGDMDECFYSVNSVEEFDPKHEEWQFFDDPSQEQFYPVIE